MRMMQNIWLSRRKEGRAWRQPWNLGWDIRHLSEPVFVAKKFYFMYCSVFRWRNNSFFLSFFLSIFLVSLFLFEDNLEFFLFNHTFGSIPVSICLGEWNSGKPCTSSRITEKPEEWGDDDQRQNIMTWLKMLWAILFTSTREERRKEEKVVCCNSIHSLLCPHFLQNQGTIWWRVHQENRNQTINWQCNSCHHQANLHHEKSGLQWKNLRLWVFSCL